MNAANACKAPVRVDDATFRVLYVDADRYDSKLPPTGYLVTARTPDGWQVVDIGALDARSLRLWMRSRGGVNSLAEDVVAHLLGHCNEPL